MMIDGVDFSEEEVDIVVIDGRPQVVFNTPDCCSYTKDDLLVLVRHLEGLEGAPEPS